MLDQFHYSLSWTLSCFSKCYYWIARERWVFFLKGDWEPSRLAPKSSRTEIANVKGKNAYIWCSWRSTTQPHKVQIVSTVCTHTHWPLECICMCVLLSLCSVCLCLASVWPSRWKYTSQFSIYQSNCWPFFIAIFYLACFSHKSATQFLWPLQHIQVDLNLSPNTWDSVPCAHYYMPNDWSEM